jgi:hypothetical protein
MREVAFSRRRAGARLIVDLGVVAVGQMAAQPTAPLERSRLLDQSKFARAMSLMG